MYEINDEQSDDGQGDRNGESKHDKEENREGGEPDERCTLFRIDDGVYKRYDLRNRKREASTGSAKLRRIAASQTIQRRTWKVCAHMLFFYK